MQTRANLYINGRWVAPMGNKTIDVICPSTEKVIGSIPEGNAQDVQSAVSAAKAAFGAWSSTTPQERITYLQRIHEGLKARADELARTIASEVGMPLKMSARVQVGSPVAIFGWYAKMLAEFQFEQKVGN